MLLIERECAGCGIKKELNYYGDGYCGECKKKREEIKRKGHFEFLDTLTLEQRIRKIEEQIYDLPKQLSEKADKQYPLR
jgi:hypothetical protein